MNKSEISKAFKQTEGGLIPLDWCCLKFIEVAELITCGIAATPVYVYNGKGFPFLSSTNVKKGKVFWSNFKNISNELHQRLYRNNPPRKGDLLYSRVGTIGEAAVIEVDFEFSIYVSLTLIKTGKRLFNYFLKHLLNSKSYKKLAIEQVYLGSGVGNLNVEVVRNYPIIFPPTIEEQNAIAKALSDTDDLIESLEQLIDKKRLIKKGAMQELLTGKRRLPGFKKSGSFKQTEIGLIPEDWRIVRLGMLGQFSKGSGICKADVGSGALPCIRYGEIYTHHHNSVKKFYSFISEFVAKQAKLITCGDIIFAGSGETKEDIGKCVAYLDEEHAYAGGDTVIFSPTETLSSMLLAYLLNSDKIIGQKSAMGQGQTVVHISADNLKKLILIMPQTLEEQKAIAQVLTDMDSEIEALEKKLGKYCQIKQGMMEKLLTGKIRLI